jgi:hypothetical protein
VVAVALVEVAGAGAAGVQERGDALVVEFAVMVVQ